MKCHGLDVVMPALTDIGLVYRPLPINYRVTSDKTGEVHWGSSIKAANGNPHASLVTVSAPCRGSYWGNWAGGNQEGIPVTDVVVLHNEPLGRPEN